MEQKEASSKSGCRVNNCYHTGTKMESEEEFMPTSSASRDKGRALQNEIAQMRKTLDQEICLRTMREQELRIKEAIVEKLQKSLNSEKDERMRLVEESKVVKNACNELEERLNELLLQMHRALGNKILLLGVATKGNELISEKERDIDGLHETIEQDQQARSKVEEVSKQARNSCSELKERWENELHKLEQTMENEICLRNTREKELTEMRTTVDELQTTLREEHLKGVLLEEDLSQQRAVCNALKERLDSELKQMQRTLANEISFRCAREQELRENGIFVDELHRTLEEQQLEKTSVQKELNQTRSDYKELAEKFESQIAQMQRTLEDEKCLRTTKEQQLKEKDAIVEELEETLRKEQRKRTILEEELSQARIDGVEQKERMENEIQRTLNIEKRLYETKVRQLDKLKQRLSEEEQIRTRVEEELSQARTTHTQVRERLENELARISRMHGDEVSLRATAEQQLSEKETIINKQRITLGEKQREFEDELNSTISYYRDQIETKDSALREQHQQETALETRLRELQLQIEEERSSGISTERELESALSAAQNACVRHQPRDWIIQREEIILSERVLGKGGWGKVFEGTFRSCQVAVKKIHELILSEHNRRLFEREMNIASCCRHPNLLQFIGATNDDGSPLFVTELLDTTLRHKLSQRALKHEEIVSLALDVARGLNYLHLNRPHPIIHRDISSANVLLWRRDERWRAKLSDFGSANFLRQCTTVNPGATIYSAPETVTTDAQQSTKVDVYSFGVLLCEMCIREQPSPRERRNQIAQITNDTLRRLTRRCVTRNPEERPAISDVINTLEEPTRTTGVLSRGRTLFRL